MTRNDRETLPFVRNVQCQRTFAFEQLKRVRRILSQGGDVVSCERGKDERGKAITADEGAQNAGWNLLGCDVRLQYSDFAWIA